MAKTFKRGDHVAWNSEAGRVRGTVIKKVTSALRFKGYVHHASKDDPQYLIRSDKTDHVAIHKGRALRLLHSKPIKKGRQTKRAGRRRGKRKNQSSRGMHRSGGAQPGAGLQITEDLMIKLKRAYEPADSSDGARYLVERLWPRGVKKTALGVDGWLKDIAPSTKLRQWYGHDPRKWREFQRRYVEELHANHQALEPLLGAARQGNVTLVYSAQDTEHNSAVVLKKYVEQKIGKTSTRRRRPAA